MNRESSVLTDDTVDCEDSTLESTEPELSAQSTERERTERTQDRPSARSHSCTASLQSLEAGHAAATLFEADHGSAVAQAVERKRCRMASPLSGGSPISMYLKTYGPLL